MTMISVISTPPGISIHSGRCRLDSGLTFLGAGRCPAVPGVAAGAATPWPASGAVALLMALRLPTSLGRRPTGPPSGRWRAGPSGRRRDTEPLDRSGIDWTTTLVSASWVSPQAPVNGVATDLADASVNTASLGSDFSAAADWALTGRLPKILKYSSWMAWSVSNLTNWKARSLFWL